MCYFVQVPPSLSTKECFELPSFGSWDHGLPRIVDILTRASPLIGEWPRAHYRFPDGKLPRGPGCPTHGLWVAGVRPGVFSEIMEIEEGG